MVVAIHASDQYNLVRGVTNRLTLWYNRCAVSCGDSVLYINSSAASYSRFRSCSSVGGDRASLLMDCTATEAIFQSGDCRRDARKGRVAGCWITLYFNVGFSQVTKNGTARFNTWAPSFTRPRAWLKQVAVHAHGSEGMASGASTSAVFT
jgi:hypothetical protein